MVNMSKFIKDIEPMNIIFLSTSNESASIRVIARDEGLFHSERVFHLPPLHRLKSDTHTVFDVLKKSNKHTIENYLYDHQEYIIMLIDGIDLSSLWLFLDTKLVFSIHLLIHSN